MKRTLAITTTAAALALSLAGCGADGGMDLMPGDNNGTGAGGTTATDTMLNDDGQTGTGMTGGASTNNTLNSVTGAVSRAFTGREETRVNGDGAAVYHVGGSAGYRTNSGSYSAGSKSYTAMNNGGLTSGSAARSERDAAAMADRYTLMLENARVHDRDGFLLDGENSSYRTF